MQSHAFQVDVTLTPAARQLLEQRGERLKAFGDAYGMPNTGVRTEGGELQLGKFNTGAVPVGAAIKVPAMRLDGPALQRVTGDLLLLVNVVSARLSSRDNLLSCDFYQGPLPLRPVRHLTLQCGLITENPPTRQITTLVPLTRNEP